MCSWKCRRREMVRAGVGICSEEPGLGRQRVTEGRKVGRWNWEVVRRKTSRPGLNFPWLGRIAQARRIPEGRGECDRSTPDEVGRRTRRVSTSASADM